MISDIVLTVISDIVLTELRKNGKTLIVYMESELRIAFFSTGISG